MLQYQYEIYLYDPQLSTRNDCQTFSRRTAVNTSKNKALFENQETFDEEDYPTKEISQGDPNLVQEIY